MVIKTKNINNLPEELQHDIYKIAIGNNPYLIGSGSITSITYNSDFDINEKVIVKNLKEHIDNLKKEKNIWIVSVHDTKKYIQINTICNINGILIDVNDTIFVNNQPSKREKETLLKKDIQDMIKKGNYFKAIKRLFSLLSLNQKKNIKQLDYIIQFLNSNIGLLSSIVNQLEIIKNFSKIANGDQRSLSQSDEPKLIFDNLEKTKMELNKIYCVPIEDKLFKMFNMKNINKLISILDKKLQNYTKDFISLNKHLFT